MADVKARGTQDLEFYQGVGLILAWLSRRGEDSLVEYAMNDNGITVADLAGLLRFEAHQEGNPMIEPTCKDCETAAKHAYSDATTPGFFSPKCTKHRVACKTCGSDDPNKNLRVKTPSGVLADGCYSWPLPHKLPDRFENYFLTDDAEIVKCDNEAFHGSSESRQAETREPRDGEGPYSIGSPIWNGLSKLIEECGEVAQVCGKILGTGGKEAHWDGSNLRQRLEEEVADLTAAISFVVDENGLSKAHLITRSDDKLRLFRKWNDDAKREEPRMQRQENNNGPRIREKSQGVHSPVGSPEHNADNRSTDLTGSQVATPSAQPRMQERCVAVERVCGRLIACSVTGKHEQHVFISDSVDLSANTTTSEFRGPDGSTSTERVVGTDSVAMTAAKSVECSGQDR